MVIWYVDFDFIWLDEECFVVFDNIFIDYVIMEKVDNVVCVLIVFEWDDFGFWLVIWMVFEKDVDGNFGFGDVCFFGSWDCLVYVD